MGQKKSGNRPRKPRIIDQDEDLGFIPRSFRNAQALSRDRKDISNFPKRRNLSEKRTRDENNGNSS